MNKILMRIPTRTFLEKIEKSLRFVKNEGIPMIPGVEPILLDLENLFLPSVSLEKLIVQGKNGKNETRKKIEMYYYILYMIPFFVLLKIRMFNRTKKEIICNM